MSYQQNRECHRYTFLHYFCHKIHQLFMLRKVCNLKFSSFILKKNYSILRNEPGGTICNIKQSRLSIFCFLSIFLNFRYSCLKSRNVRGQQQHRYKKIAVSGLQHFSSCPGGVDRFLEQSCFRILSLHLKY